MASIRKRRWQSNGEIKTAWIADYVDQRGARRNKTFKTKKDADAWLVTARRDLQLGTHTADSIRVTVAQAAQTWLNRSELEKLEAGTLDEYRSLVRLHITPRIGAMRLPRLTTPAVESFRDEIMREHSRVRCRKILGALRAILGEAQRRGLVAYNAAAPVRVSVRRRDVAKLASGRGIPSKAEIRAILEHAGRYRPLLVTAIFTGMRASELRGLTWDNLDFERRVIHVRQRADRWGTMGAPKSAAGRREIPMSPMVVNALKEWRLACPKGERNLVFPNGAGRVENHANTLNRGWYLIQSAAGIVGADGKHKYGFHALRHAAASLFIDQGFSPKRVQALLGHSSIQMTYDVYGHLFPSLEDDHAKIAAAEMSVVGA